MSPADGQPPQKRAREDEQTEAAQAAAKNAAEGTGSGVPGARPVLSTAGTAVRIEVTKWKGPEGVPVWDLGGRGDCGWRVLALLHGLKRTSDRNEVLSKNAKMVLSLRTMVADKLEQCKAEWSASWVPDPNATEIHDAGSSPKTPDEVIRHIRERPLRWVSWLEIHGFARALQVDIVVFEAAKKGKWTSHVFLARPRQVAVDYHAVVLNDGHFCAADPSKHRPAWKDLFKKEVPQASSQGFPGGARSRPSSSAE
jgi:hypothetical protein